jgi:hypothetical protein
MAAPVTDGHVAVRAEGDRQRVARPGGRDRPPPSSIAFHGVFSSCGAAAVVFVEC